DPFRVGRVIRAFLYTYDSFSFTRIFLGLILKGSNVYSRMPQFPEPILKGSNVVVVAWGQRG
ncbi:hypothetical protein, partial [Anditalea andensis]|uniref:hypothetical protein n=1 Tax=Anditalea andensis TaxID=1048983 RepID=UPI0005554327